LFADFTPLSSTCMGSPWLARGLEGAGPLLGRLKELRQDAIHPAIVFVAPLCSFDWNRRLHFFQLSYLRSSLVANLKMTD